MQADKIIKINLETKIKEISTQKKIRLPEEKTSSLDKKVRQKRKIRFP